MIRAAVDELEKSDRFKTVVIDTADRAYSMCLDWVCNNLGIKYPGVDDEGENDWGASWRAVRSEFETMAYRILQTGRGILFTSHMKEEEIRTPTARYTKIYPSMSKQARETVESLVDFFFFADYMRTPTGKSIRVLVAEGDDTIWAGAREIEHPLPRLIPLTSKGGYDIIQAGFRGEDIGLDAKTMMPAATASEAVKKFYAGMRKRASSPAKAVHVEGKKSKKKKRRKAS